MDQHQHCFKEDAVQILRTALGTLFLLQMKLLALLATGNS